MLKGDMSLIGSRPLRVRNLSYYTEKENIEWLAKKMIEIIPYFAGFITLLFGLGFYFGLKEFKKLK